MIITTPDWVTTSVGFVAKPHGSKVNIFETTVYEPAEDTFLVLDALQLDLECMIRGRLLCETTLSTKCGPLLVVEMGSGAGLVIAAIAKALSNASNVVGAHCVAVDLNPAACLVTAQTCELNGVQVEVLRGDLLTWMRQFNFTRISGSSHQDVYGSIDVLLFNPPYVRGGDGEPAPSPSKLNVSEGNVIQDHELSMMADAAWLGGGPDGIDVLQRALHQAADMLSERGVFYVLMINYNFKALVMNEIRSRRNTSDQNINLENCADYFLLTTYGSGPDSKPLACRRLLSRRIPGEELAVYRIYRPHIVDDSINNFTVTM